MNFSDFSSKSLSTPTCCSGEGQVSSLELYISSRSLRLEVILDCFEERLYSSDIKGIDPLCRIMCQFGRNHCGVKPLTVDPLPYFLCFLFFHRRSRSIIGNGRN